MASVFLSYSREDVAKAEAVAAALEGLGHSVWWDRQLHGGSRFTQEIEQALKGAQVVLVLWSRASVESAWVQDEAAEGRDSGRLVPAVIDDCKPPLGFRQYQAIDLSAAKGKKASAGITELHRAILAKDTAPGGKPEEPRPPPLFPKRSYGRPAAIAAAALVAILVAGLVYWLAGTSVRSNPDALRLQLGEFKALAAGVPLGVPDTLREEILAALATDAVIVASGTDGSGKADSGYALTASIRPTGELLRFTVHLVNARSGAAVWTETLDRPAEPAELAPRQVAVAISQVLRCGLGGAARHGKPLPDETMSIYMSFCEEYWADTAGKVLNPSRAVDLAHRLTEAAPDFSRGWSALAEVATWAVRGDRPLDAKALHAKAVKAAERALELDPQNSEAYQALAALQPPFAFAEREKLHIKSVSVRPGDCGCEYIGYAGFLNRVGRNAEATDAYKRAHDMIPLSAEVNTRWVEGLFLAGREEDGRRIVQNVLAIWPDYSFLHEVLLENALWAGKHEEALALIDNPVTPLREEERQALRQAVDAMKRGNAAANASAAAAMVKLAAGNRGASMQFPAALHALGAETQALAMVAQLVEQEGAWALHHLFHPAFTAGRNTPQFAQLAQRFGMIDYWRQSKRGPDFCKEKGAPALCRRI